MGQQASQPPNQSIANLQIPSQQEKLKFAISNPSFLQPSEEPLFGRCCTLPSNSTTNQKWKRQMLTDLEESKCEIWPSLLIKVLKQSNTQTADLIYQSDMYWVIKKENAEPPTAMHKESLQSFELPSFDCSRPDLDFNGTQEIRFQLGRDDDKKEKDPQSIKRRSDSSEFFAERVSAQTNSRIFMNKSLTKGRPTLPIMSLIRQNSQDPEFGECLSPYYRIGEATVAPKLNGPNDSYRNTGFQGYSPTIKENETVLKGQTRLFKCLQKYRMVTSLLKKHLSIERNIFFMLINEFTKYFIDTFGEAKKKFEIKKFSPIEIEGISTRAAEDVEKFIDVLYESINRYYKLDRLRQMHNDEYKTFFRKDNLVRSLTSIVFNQKISSVLLDLYSLQQQKIEQICEKNFNLLQNVPIEHFGVDEKLTLNNTTLTHLKERGYLHVKSVHSNLDQTFSFEEKREIQKESFLQEGTKDDNTIMMESNLKAKVQDEDLYYPYKKVIEKLSSIRTQPSPVYKLEILIKAVKMIQTSIKEFYADLGLRYDENLNNNQLLVIFYYILIKSRFHDIYTHVQIIKRFVPKYNMGPFGLDYIKNIETIVTYIETKDMQKIDTLENIALELCEMAPLSLGRATSCKPQNNTFDNI